MTLLEDLVNIRRGDLAVFNRVNLSKLVECFLKKLLGLNELSGRLLLESLFFQRDYFSSDVIQHIFRVLATGPLLIIQTHRRFCLIHFSFFRRRI